MRKVLISTSIGIALVASLVSPAQAESQRNYIVVFKDSSTVATRDAAIKKSQGKQNFTFGRVLNGASVKMTESQAQKLSVDSNVLSVEVDATVYALDTQLNPPSWGLDRIDQATNVLDRQYIYPTAAGAGVNVFVVDTGVANVSDLSGRINSGCSVFPATAVAACLTTNSTVDDNGHGTHVSGTVAGTAYGVAKLASITPVKVLDATGSGSISGVIAGLNWVLAQQTSPTLKSVVNMSLGGGYNSALNTAVNNLVKAGITVAVAAGNDGKDACRYSPASAANALTIGATDKNDTRASFSNYGKCVDIFAPGVGITSDTPSGGTATWNGTSMATPHAAGVAALILASGYKTPAEVATTISNTSAKNILKVTSSGSPNKLLQSPK